MSGARWVAVTPTGYEHEREAFEQLKAAMPDVEPYRAWSNFTFTASNGAPYEVDTLILAPAGLFLIEVKSWIGHLTASGNNWVQANGGKVTFHDNPYHLADAKAKRLKGLLQARAAHETFVPFVQAAVYFSKTDLEIHLPDHHKFGVYGRPRNVPEITDLITSAPRHPNQLINAARAAEIIKLLGEVGIRRSQKYYQVGMWQLDTKPFASGPTWQDHLARHKALEAERRRVRLYLVESQAGQDQRASIERAARREMAALHGIDHPNIVRVDSMEPHDVGPALVYRYDPRSLRLDQYLAQWGDRLTTGDRIRLVRQLAETIAYAHGHRLYHRALSARSLHVVPAGRKSDPDEQAWTRPRLEVIDWHVASRGDSTQSSTAAVEATHHVGFHLSKDVGGYLAPEWQQPHADPVALDVFGLGAVGYALLTNDAPASDQADLLQRLASENGLRPSSLRDGVSPFADELVQAATAPQPDARLATVAEFLEMLETLENSLIESSRAISTEPAAIDPLEAHAGDAVGEWTILKKLGTGSTCRAFLAEHATTKVRNVLKIALSQEKAHRLVHEANVLGMLRNDSRVIRLERPDPIELPADRMTRTTLVFEFVSDQTLARKLREDGRLTVDELEKYGDHLFDAVAFLEGEGVKHRDIKPDNIVVRTRPNRTKVPVIFDFSLASVSVQDLKAGTRGYLDPFLGTGKRQVYDQAAEMYALAVTLHEMASGQLPVWGDGRTEARFTDGPVSLATEAFEPMLRDGLAAFFARSLERDVEHRFGTLGEMRRAWAKVFQVSDGTVHPDEPSVSVDDIETDRDESAGQASLDTPLQISGLSPRAVSAASRVDATTVGELLKVAGKVLFNLPGMGANTRKELQRRIREWRQRLGDQAPSPSIEVTSGSVHPLDVAEEDLTKIGLDDLTTLLLPDASTPSDKEPETVRLLLGLPDANGEVPSPWAQQPQVASQMKVSSARITQIIAKHRQRWHEMPPVTALRDEVVALLRQRGRVAGVLELAEALLTSRGSVRVGRARIAVATAAVRAAYEVDSRFPEQALRQRRHGEQIILALEVLESDSPETPSAPALLDYADALGKIADQLAAEEALPSAATVLRALRAVKATTGIADGIDERRLVQIAAAASRNAACNARLEIYPRNLPPERALRLAQAGIVPQTGASPGEIRQRVAAWFPALEPLPGRTDLDDLLKAAGFKLRWNGAEGKYFPPAVLTSSALTSNLRRSSSSRSASRWTAESPELSSAHKADEQLTASARSGGFRALTVRLARAETALRRLERWYKTDTVDVSALFLDELHKLVESRPKPTWQTVINADLAEPNSSSAIRFAGLIEQAWKATAPRLASAMTPNGTVLLHNAAVLARYRGMGVLHDLRTQVARGGTLWLLCPVQDLTATPRLDTVSVEVAPHEWTILNDEWTSNAHQALAQQ